MINNCPHTFRTNGTLPPHSLEACVRALHNEATNLAETIQKQIVLRTELTVIDNNHRLYEVNAEDTAILYTMSHNVITKCRKRIVEIGHQIVVLEATNE